jgi:hypothetical protein
MGTGTIVFYDGTTPVSQLIEAVSAEPLTLSFDEVSLEEPGHPIAGENWAPQLTPYKPWQHDETSDTATGADGDLYVVGALGMGISDEERQVLIGPALAGETGEKTEEEAADSARAAEGAPKTTTASEISSPSSTSSTSSPSSPSATSTQGGAASDDPVFSAWTHGEDMSDFLVEATRAYAAKLGLDAEEALKGKPAAPSPSASRLKQGLVAAAPTAAAPTAAAPTVSTPTASTSAISTRATSAEVAVPAALSAESSFALNVPLSVRRDGEGYAVSAVHLSVLAEHNLPTEDLVVVIPSFIDGVPVVRITAEAFSRRITSGAHVRLLVIPDTVEVVGAQAFSAVSADTIYLGAGVKNYDPVLLDMALPSPRLTQRNYLVSPKNSHFRMEGGCLIETRAEKLVCANAPYERHLQLPAGIKVVGASAFAKGCTPPHVIDVPASLTRIDAIVDPETLWRAPDARALAPLVKKSGGRVTDFKAVEVDDCWYGFAKGEGGKSVPSEGDDSHEADSAPSAVASAATSTSATAKEAHLVAGPPAPDSVSRQFAQAAHARLQGEVCASPFELAANAASAMVAPRVSADRLSLPPSIEEATLTTVAERALITAPSTLSIPSSVRTIEAGNACKGTTKLMLAEGLKRIGAHCFCSRTLEGPVYIPASVTSIGEGCFEYTVVYLAAADTIVHITSDQLMSCFREDAIDGVPFDFAQYDAQLLVGRGLPDYLGALLHRLAAPYKLDAALRDAIVAVLKARANEVFAAVARTGDAATVHALAEGGFLNDEVFFNKQIEHLRSHNRTKCVLYLMNWKQEQQQATRASTPQRARDRFAL